MNMGRVYRDRKTGALVERVCEVTTEVSDVGTGTMIVYTTGLSRYALSSKMFHERYELHAQVQEARQA